MEEALNILFATSEASPIAKMGGLADVAGSLPQELRRAGHDVRLVMPRYGSLDLSDYPVQEEKSFTMGYLGNDERITICRITLGDGLPVYLAGNERYFGMPGVYGEWNDLERFFLFHHAVLATPKLFNWRMDILHANDWHTGATPAMLKFARKCDPFYAGAASVLTIHNLAYQGWFDDYFAWRGNLHQYITPPGDPLRPNLYSLLALGIYHADVISTVSKTYAREILTPEYGERLDPVLRMRQNSLSGIRNGLNYREFDPVKDPALAANFDVASLDKRVKNKLELQKRVGLPINPEVPVIGSVGRLASQKGPDVIAGALRKLLAETDVQFVMLGSGEAQFEKLLKLLEVDFPDKARVLLNANYSFGQLVYGGSDIFLMPSRYEPFGIAPLIAMRYGAVPVARRTGGLAENIPDISPDLKSGLGFMFDCYEESDLYLAIKRALNACRDKERWRGLVIRGMKANFSWEASIPKYEALYRTAKSRVPRG